MKDTLFKHSNSAKPFEFNEDVANVFDDMLERSIPLYTPLQQTITDLCRLMATDSSHIYDIGCSTGTTIHHLSHSLSPHIKLHGVDASEHMIKKATSRCAHLPNVQFSVSDLTVHPSFPNADILILNLVLQFIPIEKRQPILTHCLSELQPNGCLVLVEKIMHPSSIIQSIYTSNYHQFKEKNGYSKQEIINKAASLKNVLHPLSIDDNMTLLKSVGFSNVATFFQWMNFVGIIAINAPRT